MKKTMLTTLIVGIIINVVVNLLVHGDALTKFVFLYAYFPICFLAVGYGLKHAKVKDWPWIATVVTSPVYLGFIGAIFVNVNPDLFFNWVFRAPLISILGSVLILEYYLYKLFPKE